MSLYRFSGSDDPGYAGMSAEPAVPNFSARLVEGVVWFDWVPGCDVSLADARASLAVARAMTEETPIRLVTDLRSIRGISREARAYFTAAGSGWVVAMLVDSPLSRVIANFFVALTKGSATLKAFTEPEAAMAWHRRKSPAPH